VLARCIHDQQRVPAAIPYQQRHSVGPAAVRLKDTSSGYGWISIALHWLTAAIVLTMWTVGTMSQVASEDDAPALVHLHTTIGMTVYALVWGRIIWRFTVGHPGPLPRQSAFLFPVAKSFHFLLLVAIGVMLLSGPLMVWSDGEAIDVFAFSIPSPFGKFPAVHDILRRVHGMTATFILVGIVLHVLAVLKHVIVNRDGTFDKIMVADGVGHD
jgi:cytochrome b561